MKPSNNTHITFSLFKKFIIAILISICIFTIGYSSTATLTPLSVHADNEELTFLGGFFDYFPLSGFGKEDISSSYGYRIHPIYGGGDFHGGIDISAPSGTPIHACSAGLVIESTYGSSTGNYIIIDHGNGVYSEYMHQSQLLAKKGDYVNAGQVIGLVGSTGDSTGPHLHIGVVVSLTGFDYSKRVDPTPFLFGSRVKEINYENPVCILAITHDGNVFSQEKAVIAQYGDLYLLEYDGTDLAKKAYQYYYPKVDAITYDIEDSLLDYYVDNKNLSDYKKQTEELKTENLSSTINSALVTSGVINENDTSIEPNDKGNDLDEQLLIQGNTASLQGNIIQILMNALNQKQEDADYQIALIGNFVNSSDLLPIVQLYEHEESLDTNSFQDVTQFTQEIQNLEQNRTTALTSEFSESEMKQILALDIVKDEYSYSTSSFAAAIIYAMQSGVKVIVLPEGSYESANNDLIQLLLQWCSLNGIIIVCPAGDSASNIDNYISLNTPVCMIGMCNDSGLPSSQTNYGEMLEYYANMPSTYSAALHFAHALTMNTIQDIQNGTVKGLFYEPSKAKLQALQELEKINSNQDNIEKPVETKDLLELVETEDTKISSSGQKALDGQSITTLVRNYLDYMLQ